MSDASAPLSHANRWKRWLAWLLLASICLLPLVYFTIYRSLDAAVCYGTVAKRLNIAPTDAAIREYILDTLRPGMRRGDVNAILGRIGNVRVMNQYQSNDSSTVDVLRLEICSHPLNNLRINLSYSESDVLLSVQIEED